MTAVEQGPDAMTVTANAHFGLPGRGARQRALLLAVLFTASAAAAQERAGYFIPGNPKAGMSVFFAKGCAKCHSVLGEGGRSAPDLARAPGDHMSADDLLATMWNHAPTMWERMSATKVASPRFSETEMQDLFAFLYSVRSLDVPGDAERGHRLILEKRCLTCHAVGRQGGRTGPDLERWTQYRNPVSWIQTMWNHGPAMRATMAQRGIEWPVFEGSDVADLIAYVRKLAPGDRKKVYLRPANPEAGRAVFKTKGCISCHSVGGGTGGRRAPDLGSSTLPRTLGQFAASMWNHGPTMWGTMEQAQVRQRQFTNAEMADLIAYLFSERYFELRGNAQRGASLFQEKRCSLCHQAQGPGPDLSAWAHASPATLATGLWNHGPAMLERMHQQNIDWPFFRHGEIADLLEFLRRNKPPKRTGGAP